MKRLAAVAVMVAWFSCGAFAQRGGSHGGFSGSHGGFSGSHAGFSAPAGGFSGHSAPGFHSGFSAPRGGFGFSGPRSGFRPAPPGLGGRGFGGPARFPSSYPGGGPRRPVGGPHMPSSFIPRTPSGSMHRAPYHSPYGGNHGHNGYHDHHNHVVFFNGGYPWGWGYPYYGYGYPYLWPSIFDDSDNYDSQAASNYPDPQQQPSGYDNGPYQPQPEDPVEPAPREPDPPQPSASHRAPHGGARSDPPAPEGAVTLVFKDGRPSEHIYNYLMTAKTLTVLDQDRRVIPLDQLDLEATAKASIQAGVEFSVPIQTP